MSIHFDLSSLRRTQWFEYLLRFLFGGTITVIAGLLAKHFGPVFGGLFLAFPAIFPAAATLVEKHEREKKLKAGIRATARGRKAAALDARGTALGSVALIAFAWMVWKVLPLWNGALTLSVAVLLWFALAVLAWKLRKHLRWPISKRNVVRPARQN